MEADKDDPQEAQELTCPADFPNRAQETTHALDEIVWTVNPSNDTLDGLVNYICKPGRRITWRWRACATCLDAPAQLPKTAISPETRHNVFLAAKEAVTNIVKQQSGRDRGRPAPAAWRRKGFTLEIQDNGRGPAGLKQKRRSQRN